MNTAKRRTVRVELAMPDRACLFCLSKAGTFESEEHVVPRSLGPEADRYVIPPGVVCDDCNRWLGKQIDAPFAHRFDIRLTRGLERIRGRGGIPDTIDGRNATARLEVEIEGGKVALYAARVDETADGGLDIEIRPRERDPNDIVARTFRALWKIALGCAWLDGRNDALDPHLDYMRQVILGAPFKGYLLQAPFTAQVTRRLDVNIDFRTPSDPLAMTFVMGGVALAVPLAPGAKISPAHARDAGWEVRSTDSVAPRLLHLRLEPSEARVAS